MNSSSLEVWKDSLKLLDKKSRFITKQKEAYEAELSILNQNSKLGSTTESLKPSTLKELLELNRTKQIELKKLVFDADEENNELKNSMLVLQNQLNQSSTNALGKPIRVIVLKVNSNSEVNTQFKISYLVTNANWVPTYELRCENTSKPLALTCRAKIIQTTGFDWKHVHIKLSTANPTQNHNRPVLYPIYVDWMQPDFYQNKLMSNNIGYSNSMNTSSDKELKAPAPVQMMLAGSRDEDFSDGMKLDEKSVTISEGDLMVEYEIEDKQDIESDGQEHILAIQELSLPAQYNYHCVPKLDNSAFLLARVTDWGKFNLLSGDATIFFNDMYVGKSYLNPNVSSDTLLISLGRDEQLNVKRTKVNELCTSKKFSSKKKETKAFETLIKNNKSYPVEMEILDQYPISRNSEIEVILEEAEGAQITKEYGKLLWRIKLQAGESKKIKLVYSIKFPEEKIVAERN